MYSYHRLLLSCIISERIFRLQTAAIIPNFHRYPLVEVLTFTILAFVHRLSWVAERFVCFNTFVWRLSILSVDCTNYSIYRLQICGVLCSFYNNVVFCLYIAAIVLSDKNIWKMARSVLKLYGIKKIPTLITKDLTKTFNLIVNIK